MPENVNKIRCQVHIPKDVLFHGLLKSKAQHIIASSSTQINETKTA